MKICPVPMRKGAPCDETCPFYGPFFVKQLNAVVTTCGYLHKAIFTDNDKEGTQVVPLSVASMNTPQVIDTGEDNGGTDCGD